MVTPIKQSGVTCISMQGRGIYCKAEVFVISICIVDHRNGKQDVSHDQLLIFNTSIITVKIGVVG